MLNFFGMRILQAIMESKWAHFAIVLLSMVIFSSAEAQDEDLPAKVKERMTLRTPVSDELLHALEKDFLELLKKSKHAMSLIEAEELLDATNDNTHWTNYASATKILRATHDIAAIPLLLRFIVVHSKRSACHIMLPEYVKSISIISGVEQSLAFEGGPNLEERMRTNVATIYNEWWRTAKSTLATEPTQMSPEQLRVIVANLLKQVRRDGDFSGAGGQRDSAYGAYHNVYYRLKSNNALERNSIFPLQPGMLPMFLESSGYRMLGTANAPGADSVFPFETIVILSEYAKKIGHEELMRLAADDHQTSTVRMICMFALYRAGYAFDTARCLQLLKSETDLERRLILLLALRWGDQQAVPTLLEFMEDNNIEIATAAACAVHEFHPPEFVSKLEKLLNRNFDEPPLLLLNTVAAHKSSDARALLERMLKDAVDGTRNTRHVYRILNAFIDAWEIPRQVLGTRDDRDYEKQARLALDYAQARVAREQAEVRKLEALVESLRTQLRIALEIERIRREEYKRLLILQGDEIVTPEESRRAQDQLRASSLEVETFRNTLREKDAQVKSLTKRNDRME